MENSKPSIESNTKSETSINESPSITKKPVKPPKIEDKPFDEFISNYFIPGLRKSIQDKGSNVIDIKLIHSNRPVVGGMCWIVFC